MIRNIGGIIPLKPIGGLVTNNPASTSQEQIDAANQRKAQEEIKIEAMRQKLEQQYREKQEKK
jgi:hypothetical protein